ALPAGDRPAGRLRGGGRARRLREAERGRGRRGLHGHPVHPRGSAGAMTHVTTPARVSAVLFDVDGTLIDSYRLYLEAYRRALEPFLGYAPTDEEIAERGPSAERRFLADWVGPRHAEECHAAMRRHYEALHGALCEGPYEGVPEMLAHLRSA